MLGELALDGSLAPVAGVLPAAIAARRAGAGLICPRPAAARPPGPADIRSSPPSSLHPARQPFRGQQMLSRPQPRLPRPTADYPDLRDIKGQESAKRALEIAAAGGHNLLMIGPPGSGKSMLAARLPGDPAAAAPEEALEVSMIALARRRAARRRADRAGGRSATRTIRPAAGAGRRRHRGASPARCRWRITACCSSTNCRSSTPRELEALRQPLETGEVTVVRANHHVTYPARFQLVAAMNPCRCGHADEPALPASAAAALRRRLSGAHLGPAARPHRPAHRRAGGRRRRSVAAAAGRRLGRRRARASPRRAPSSASAMPPLGLPRVRTNAEAPARVLEEIAPPDADGPPCCATPPRRMRLSARGYHRVLRVARTLADLDGAETVGRLHLAEALSYRALADDLRRAAGIFGS